LVVCIFSQIVAVPVEILDDEKNGPQPSIMGSFDKVLKSVNKMDDNQCLQKMICEFMGQTENAVVDAVSNQFGPQTGQIAQSSFNQLQSNPNQFIQNLNQPNGPIVQAVTAQFDNNPQGAGSNLIQNLGTQFIQQALRPNQGQFQTNFQQQQQFQQFPQQQFQQIPQQQFQQIPQQQFQQFPQQQFQQVPQQQFQQVPQQQFQQFPQQQFVSQQQFQQFPQQQIQQFPQQQFVPQQQFQQFPQQQFAQQQFQQQQQFGQQQSQGGGFLDNIADNIAGTLANNLAGTFINNFLSGNSNKRSDKRSRPQAKRRSENDQFKASRVDKISPRNSNTHQENIQNDDEADRRNIDEMENTEEMFEYLNQALNEIAQENDMKSLNGSSREKRQTSAHGHAIRLMQNLGLNNMGIYPFVRAAIIGHANRRSPTNCRQLFQQCPDTSDQLLDYFNNHNGGLFQNAIPSATNEVNSLFPGLPSIPQVAASTLETLSSSTSGSNSVGGSLASAESSLLNTFVDGLAGMIAGGIGGGR